MKMFFLPAEKISNLLTFKAKFVLVTLLCAIPLLIFYFSLSNEQARKLSSIEYGLKATQYIVPLRNLVEHIAQTRGMTNAYLNGDHSFKNKIISKRDEVNSDFSSLLLIDKKFGEEFKAGDSVGMFMAEWESISNIAFDGSSDQIFSRYTLLVENIIDYMDTIGRHGHLFQMVDPSNTYMINSLLHTLPAQIESLGVLRGMGSGIIAANSLTPENKLAVAKLSNSGNAVKLKKDIEYLFMSSPELASLLGGVFQAADQQLGGYLNLANEQIVNAEISTVDASDFFSQGTKTISSLFDLFDQVRVILNHRMEQQRLDAVEFVRFYTIMSVVVLLLLVYAYTGIYLGIHNNLMAMISVSNAICDGNLDARLSLKTKDELHLIANSLNEVAEGVSRSIIAIRGSSNDISRAAQVIALESMKTAESMMTQSRELTQTSTAITEMSASVNEVAKNTELGSTAAQRANEYAVNGGRVVQETLKSINILADNVSAAVQGVTALKDSSNNITKILDVIRGIAEQTNLLALNAAIEAARAGDQGRGFAVVADEVRTLAKRTQDSTLEIQSMIEQIQSGITEVALAMSESQEHAGTAVGHAQNAGEALLSISSSVGEVRNMSMQIALAAEEQSAVSEGIARSIVTVSGVATDASRGAQSLAESGSKIEAMSKEMDLMVSRYAIDEKEFDAVESKQRLLRWESKYDLGVAEADRQHKKMLDMMNDVHIRSAKSRDNSSIAQALDALIEYTAVHFHWEEELFDGYGYPKSEQHKNDHKKLLNELRDHQKKIQVGDKGQIDAEMLKLNDWLVKHILHADSDYASYIANKGYC